MPRTTVCSFPLPNSTSSRRRAPRANYCHLTTSLLYTLLTPNPTSVRCRYLYSNSVLDTLISSVMKLGGLKLNSHWRYESSEKCYPVIMTNYRPLHCVMEIRFPLCIKEWRATVEWSRGYDSKTFIQVERFMQVVLN